MGLACTWAQAALMSDRVLRSSFIPSPRNPHDGASVAGTSARLAPKGPLPCLLTFYFLVFTTPQSAHSNLWTARSRRVECCSITASFISLRHLGQVSFNCRRSSNWRRRQRSVSPNAQAMEIPDMLVNVVAGYTSLANAALAHPTMAEGLSSLFSNVPPRAEHAMSKVA